MMEADMKREKEEMFGSLGLAAYSWGRVSMSQGKEVSAAKPSVHCLPSLWVSPAHSAPGGCWGTEGHHSQ